MSASQLFGANPTPNRRGGLCVEPALAEEAPADVGVGRAEALDEELGGGLVGGQEPGAVAVVGRLPAVFVVQLEPDAAGEALDGLGEGDVVHVLQERVDVAATRRSRSSGRSRAAAARGSSGCARRGRAEALQRADAGGLQAHVLADDVGDVGAGLHLFDVALSNAARHGSHPSSPRWPDGRSRRRRGRGSAPVTAARVARTRRAPTGR